MKTRVFCSFYFAAAIGVGILAPAQASASIFTSGSQLNITGAGTVGATFLNFQCSQPADPVCVTPPPNQGDFAVANSTGTFAQYNSTYGLIMSINNGAQPLNTPFSLMNFMTFDLNNDVSIELTFIPLGNDTPSTDCAGLQHCTPQNNLLISPNNPLGLSAFNLDQSITGTAAVFGVYGIAHGSDGSTAQIAGTYTTQFTGLNPQQALALALSGNAQTYSSNIVLSVVPEPSEMLLTGLGLVGISLLGIKRRQIGR